MRSRHRARTPSESWGAARARPWGQRAQRGVGASGLAPPPGSDVTVWTPAIITRSDRDWHCWFRKSINQGTFSGQSRWRVPVNNLNLWQVGWITRTRTSALSCTWDPHEDQENLLKIPDRWDQRLTRTMHEWHFHTGAKLKELWETEVKVLGLLKLPTIDYVVFLISALSAFT